MKKYKRFIAPVIIFSVSLLSFAGGVQIFLFFSGKRSSDFVDQYDKKSAGLLRVLKNSSEIRAFWYGGEDSRTWREIRTQCLDFLKIKRSFDESLLRCHPLLLECHARFAKKKNIQYVPFVDNNFKMESFYSYVTKSNSSFLGINSSGVTAIIEDNETKERLRIFLSDQCREYYLPERAYGYSEQVLEKDGVDFLFDNIGSKIYFDYHLVTNADVNDWLRFQTFESETDDLKIRNLKIKSGDDLFLPATHLTMKQMEAYCNFKGKELLLASTFDAASFMPYDQREILPKTFHRSPVYWTKKKNETTFDCRYLFHKECLSKEMYKLNSIRPTWAGMQDSMGGVFEAFRNPIDGDSNLKASSFYFPAKHYWQRLGVRAKWDGEGFGLRNFDFRGYPPDEIPNVFQVGFRCQREQYP